MRKPNKKFQGGKLKAVLNLSDNFSIKAEHDFDLNISFPITI
jgi:hypothetical protein